MHMAHIKYRFSQYLSHVMSKSGCILSFLRLAYGPLSLFSIMKNSQSSSDEPKTIHFPGAATAEDTVLLCWNRYKKVFFVCLAAAIVGLLCMQAYDFIKAERLKSTQEAFLNAIQKHHEKAFTEAYPHDPLAGLVLIEQGDQFSAQGNYTEAAKAFALATTALKNNALAGRAYVSQGMALALEGDIQQANIIFEKTANNPILLPAYRAEAAYQRALLAVQANDMTSVNHWLTIVLTLPEGGIWSQKAQMLRTIVPIAP